MLEDLLSLVAEDPTSAERMAVYADALEARRQPCHAAYLRARLDWEPLTPLDAAEARAREGVVQAREGLDEDWLRAVGDPWLVYLPQFTECPPDRGARWRALDRLTLGMNPRARPGRELEDVREAEVRLGIRFPPGLVEWLTLPGAQIRDHGMRLSADLGPHRLKIELVHGVPVISILRTIANGHLSDVDAYLVVDDLQADDPPVYIKASRRGALQPLELVTPNGPEPCTLSVYAWTRRLEHMVLTWKTFAFSLRVVEVREDWTDRLFDELANDVVFADWEADGPLGRVSVCERRDSLVMQYRSLFYYPEPRTPLQEQSCEVHAAARTKEAFEALPAMLRDAAI